MVHSNQIRKFELMDKYPRGVSMFPKVTLSNSSETNEIKKPELHSTPQQTLKRGRNICPSATVVRRSKRIKSLRDQNRLCLNYKN